jgi:hypothetical protein
MTQPIQQASGEALPGVKHRPYECQPHGCSCYCSRCFSTKSGCICVRCSCQERKHRRAKGGR